MERKVIITDDGSVTISAPELNETYHSRYGAMQESVHVYIKAGLEWYIANNPGTNTVHIFEMGFGTGLNALLTHQYAKEHNLSVYYETIELYPLEDKEISQVNYAAILHNEEVFAALHAAPWDKMHIIDNSFSIKKIKDDIKDYLPQRDFQIIYYDAFSPNVQPALWSNELFIKLFNILQSSGVLVTYCSKGAVTRAMKHAGFAIKKIPGPTGKREMTRATV